MAKYGYIAGVPTQSSSANTGIFNMTDIVKLKEAGKWTQQTADITYMAIAGGGRGKWDFRDFDDVLANLFDLCTDPDFASPLTIIVVGSIQNASGGEIRKKSEFLFAKGGDAGIEKFAEIVRENFGG